MKTLSASLWRSPILFALPLQMITPEPQRALMPDMARAARRQIVREPAELWELEAVMPHVRGVPFLQPEDLVGLVELPKLPQELERLGLDRVELERDVGV